MTPWRTSWSLNTASRVLQGPPDVATANSEEEEDNDVFENMRDYNDSDTVYSLEVESEQYTLARPGANARVCNIITESCHLSSVQL